ncbi:MAG: TIGR04282 family arsenosugar biosynthesis glycosyltransferase [Verrucomicrobia bacterium]|nr:TIGR04282 family arsenosugar biosynthesis glycosyltransferase [Verrucomicrobiota bacterium]
MNRLIIFVKAPRPGHVKTRLAASIGPEEACAAYRMLVTELLDRLNPLDQVELRYSPDDAIDEIQPWLRETWIAQPQGPGDLGARMENAFANAFTSGCARVALIGSDCPDVSVADVEEACQSLSAHELVLGPARDGGYWLIALRQSEPSLFSDMPWSTERVLRETVRRADAKGWRVRLLREITDVDTESEWKRYQESRALWTPDSSEGIS